MPKFSANLAQLFADVPYFDRFELASQSGFKAVDLENPYGPAANETQMALSMNDLSLVSIGGPPPNYAGDTPDTVAQSGFDARFQKDVQRTYRYAKTLKASLVDYRIGDGNDLVLFQNLRWAAEFDPKRTLMIRPNPDSKLLGDNLLVADMINRVDRPNIKMVFDLSLALQRNALGLADWKDIAAFVAHIQLLAPPNPTGRKSRDPGLEDFFQTLDESDYSGWVSTAFVPKTRSFAKLQ